MEELSPDDRLQMQRALRLGRRALGTTAENPPVGCVIARQGRILGLGWTQPGGRPHAEAVALAIAGDAASGATAYVTLEPCAHHGRSGPCAQALARAGIARVMSALEDPDPRVSGRGHALLREAGIVVATGLGAAEARCDLAGFLSRITRRRPYVVLKLAVSADGKIAARPGLRSAITGEAARARVHLLRAQCDAILVGVSTAIIDDPELTCRLPGLEPRSPIRIVADSHLRIPPDLKLVRTAPAVPLWLLSMGPGEVAPGVTVIACRAAQGRIDLADALARLAERGINRLLVEGGARIARAFLDADLVDEARIFVSPRALGAAGVPALARPLLSAVLEGWTVTEEQDLGPDRLFVYRRPSGPPRQDQECRHP